MHRLSVVLAVAVMAIAGPAAALNPQPLPPRCLEGRCPPNAHPPVIGVCKSRPVVATQCETTWNQCMGVSSNNAQACLPKWRSCCAK
jgi:hypothetical protein